MVDVYLLDRIVDTIVIVIMENRSFDHMLGHLSYQKDGNRDKVEGLRDPLDPYVNIGSDGKMYGPFLTQDTPLDGDLPHERDAVETQLAYENGAPTMRGFIKAYIEDYLDKGKTPPSPFDPMKFLKSSSVPTTNFLANNFAVCDHWFAPLPTSTHPNRCMAFGGSTPIDASHELDHGLKVEYLVLHWLDDHGIKWRVYHHGSLSSFYMFDLGFTHDPRFRGFESFNEDMQTPDDDFPQVIFIEPSYDGLYPNDNHPPLPVYYGELFLREIYEALISNAERWKKTVMIITYDEHGGFYDHIPPLRIPYVFPNGEFKQFNTTGLRVPTVIVSPLVEPGTVCHCAMDHTSILQLLAERFDHFGTGYSANVNDRRAKGINSVRSVLNRSMPRTEILAMPSVQKNSLQAALGNIANKAVKLYPNEIKKNHPKLLEWYKKTSK